MITLIIIISAIGIVVVVCLVVAMIRAPFGYEDRDGFHTGERQRHE